MKLIYIQLSLNHCESRISIDIHNKTIDLYNALRRGSITFHYRDKNSHGMRPVRSKRMTNDIKTNL